LPHPANTAVNLLNPVTKRRAPSRRPNLPKGSGSLSTAGLKAPRVETEVTETNKGPHCWWRCAPAEKIGEGLNNPRGCLTSGRGGNERREVTGAHTLIAIVSTNRP